MVVTDETFDQLLHEARRSLRNIRCEVAELRVYLALKRIVALSHKAGFNPGQLRLPAGQPGGGRWTDGDGGDVILVGGYNGHASGWSTPTQKAYRDNITAAATPSSYPYVGEVSTLTNYLGPIWVRASIWVKPR